VGADLAHVGPRFGDAAPVGEALLGEVEQADRRALDAAVAGEAEAFAQTVIEVADRFRVCGLGAIYSVLRLLDADGERADGELIDYSQATDDDRSQMVSFAGLVYRRPPR
jgi:AmmeMemoRadiSam system protein B